MARVKACSVSELPQGQCRVVKHEREYIAVFRMKDGIYAINDTCPHLGGSLGTGWMTEEGTIVCPWHGWEFRICDGAGVWPQGIDVPAYPVEIEGEDVVVVVEDDRPNKEQETRT